VSGTAPIDRPICAQRPEQAIGPCHARVQVGTRSGTHAMIRVGIGGWCSSLARHVLSAQAVAGARARACQPRVTTIEINGTFYGSQKPESFRRWAQETPDISFLAQGPRFTTHRGVLAEAGASVERFFAAACWTQGQARAVLWQLRPARRSRRGFAAFLACCRSASTAADPACGRGAAHELLRAGIRGADAASSRSQSRSSIQSRIR